MKTSGINKAIQNSINTLDKTRVACFEAEYGEYYNSELLEKLLAKEQRQYNSVAEVAKRQGFEVLTGEEYFSKTEVDVDTLNDLISKL